MGVQNEYKSQEDNQRLSSKYWISQEGIFSCAITDVVIILL